MPEGSDVDSIINSYKYPRNRIKTYKEGKDFKCLDFRYVDGSLIADNADHTIAREYRINTDKFDIHSVVRAKDDLLVVVGSFVSMAGYRGSYQVMKIYLDGRVIVWKHSKNFETHLRYLK